MTKKKPIHVNVAENLKEKSEQLFDGLGLNMTSAITIFLKQSINEQAILFMINKGNKDTLLVLSQDLVHDLRDFFEIPTGEGLIVSTSSQSKII